MVLFEFGRLPAFLMTNSMGKVSLVGREYALISLILALAALHGLLYVFLMPPWQHYDEQNHFEYVWFAANLDRLPGPQDYSPKLSRQMLKSMLEHGFFDHLGFQPVIEPPSVKVKVFGFSQLSEPPFYYLVASLPVRLFPERGLAGQLIAARMASLGFLLITILAGWGVAHELTPSGHPLRWMLPISLALTPAFVDLMTAVNNDAAAIAISSVILWLSARMIVRGFSWFMFLWMVLAGLLAYFTKITSLTVILAYPPVLLFSLLRGRLRKTAWILLALSLGVGLAYSLRWDDAFAWYRDSQQSSPIRQKSPAAPLGQYVLGLETRQDAESSWKPDIFQHISIAEAQSLAGKPVTFGYWIWSDRAQRLRAPVLWTGSRSFSEELTVSQQPGFYAFQATLPEDVNRIWVNLIPEGAEPGSMVFYDGLVLVEGHHPISATPEYSSAGASDGEWGGQPFENLLRNASFETAGPRIAPDLDNLITRYMPDQGRPSMILATLVDYRGAQDLYPITARHLFHTFWARFAWGHVPVLAADWVYPGLAVISLLGLLGAVIAAIRCFKRLPWDVIFTFGSVTVLTFFMALTRGGVYLSQPGFYYSTARYLYPAIIPIFLLLCSGWLEIFRLIRLFWNRATRRDLVSPKDVAPWALKRDMLLLFTFYLFFFLFLDLLAVLSVADYYQL